MNSMKIITNELFEKILLTSYYSEFGKYRKFLANDNTADIFKSENELIAKEFKKRYVAVADKMFDCTKSASIDNYLLYETGITDMTSFSLYFNISDYIKDINIDTPPYTPKVITEVSITKEKKLFRTIEHKTETKHLELSFSQEVIDFGKIYVAPFNYLRKSGVLPNNCYFDFDVYLGDQKDRDNICFGSELKEDKQPLNFELSKDAYSNALIIKYKDRLPLDVKEDGSCAILTKSNKQKSNVYFKYTCVKGYFISNEQLVQLLKEYCNIDIITIDEIKATIDSHPTKKEFNEWLDEKIKNVVIDGERLIEKIDY